MAEKPEDLNLPTAIVTKIIKESLPDNVNVSKDARLAISKAASVFVLYATTCANSVAQQNKRKMIGAADVYDALKEMELEHFTEPLQQFLEAYKSQLKEKKHKEPPATAVKAQINGIASPDNPDVIIVDEIPNDDDVET